MADRRPQCDPGRGWFDELAAGLAALMHETAGRAPDALVRHALGLVGDAFRADACLYIDWDPGTTRLAVRHRWRAGRGSQTSGRPLALPWLARHLRDGRPVVLRLAHLAPAAVAERRYLWRRGMASALHAPLPDGGAVRSCIALESAAPDRAWSAGDKRRLRICGDMVRAILARSRLERTLHEDMRTRCVILDQLFSWEYWLLPDGRLAYISPSCERITGYAPAAFMDRPRLIDALVLPEYRPAWRRHARRAGHRMRPASFQFRMRRRDGSVCWIEHTCQPAVGPSGETLGVRASNRDITARKQVEEELRESRRSLVAAQRIAHLGNWQWDIVSDRLNWSDEVYRIFGLQPQEFGATYKAFLQRVHPEDRPLVAAAVERSLAGQDPEYSIQHRIVRPDGTERIVHERGETTFAGERPVEMIGTVHDITEMRLMEAESRRLRLQLAHMDRVSSIGALTAAIAHEINQPLSAILGNAQAGLRFLSAGTAAPADLRDILDDIAADGKRAGEVIRRIRQLVRQEGPRRERFELNGVVREVIGLIQTELVLRNVSLQVELAEDLPALAGDPVQVQQVVLNLLKNALDAVQDRATPQRIVRIATLREGSTMLQVLVGDNGPGIPPDQMDRIFTPFFTTKTTGMGLGLPISRTIIEAHGGALWADNLPCGGALFAIRLPAARSHP